VNEDRLFGPKKDLFTSAKKAHAEKGLPGKKDPLQAQKSRPPPASVRARAHPPPPPRPGRAPSSNALFKNNSSFFFLFQLVAFNASYSPGYFTPGTEGQVQRQLCPGVFCPRDRGASTSQSNRSPMPALLEGPKEVWMHFLLE
jgi:hypothetical protein